ncbi:MAG TPA: protein O-GlcNAcase [Trueperaceae bacterium]|nr:protein O-GlcNAcase [Trueperaceae bacterium]
MSAFTVRGVVEGFYGPAYDQNEREDLLRFLGEHGYNLYLYGPKNDRQHRARWREPYSAAALEDFRSSVAVGKSAGVEFAYALSPGLDVRYASDADMKAIEAKFTALALVGVRSFALFLDDINPTFRHPEDAARFANFAAAQAELCNRVLAWLRRQWPEARLSMCPTAYHGAPPFGDYLHQLGELLAPEVDVFYTGVDVCSRTIGRHEVEAFAAALRRAPLLWDNYPVNDGGMRTELHIGPIRGRAADLPGCVKGFAVNPMNQAEASKVALHTFAAYFQDPVGYEPEAAWRQALALVAGEEHAGALEAFARTALHGVLGTEPAARLSQLAAAACADLRAAAAGKGQPGVTAMASGHDGATWPDFGGGSALSELARYLAELDAACYDLKFKLRNYALRAELLPWLEALESWLWSGRRALEVVAASRAGQDITPALKRLREPYGIARGHHKRSGGEELLPFIELALERHVGVAA